MHAYYLLMMDIFLSFRVLTTFFGCILDFLAHGYGLSRLADIFL